MKDKYNTTTHPNEEVPASRASSILEHDQLRTSSILGNDQLRASSILGNDQLQITDNHITAAVSLMDDQMNLVEELKEKLSIMNQGNKYLEYVSHQQAQEIELLKGQLDERNSTFAQLKTQAS